MTKRQLLLCCLGSLAVSWYVGTASAADTLRFADTTTQYFDAAYVFYDGFGYYQACGFNFTVAHNDKVAVHVFDDHLIYNMDLRSLWTNLESGFSFEDFASYSIRYDDTTGLAQHHGVFWRISIPGEGMVVLDAGGFLQNWYSENWPQWAIFPDSLVGHNHDVNGPYSEGIFPMLPFSYCDLMAQNFPD